MQLVYVGRDSIGYVYVKVYSSQFTKSAYVYFKPSSRSPLRYLGRLTHSLLRLFSSRVRAALRRYLTAPSPLHALLEFFESLDFLLRNSPLAQKLASEWSRIAKRYGISGTPYQLLEELLT